MQTLETYSDIKPKVLIIDDEKGLRIGTKRLLEREGYEVQIAENGTEGISFGTGREFDFAIIDLKMPDIDGISVLKKILEKYPNTICFIATAYASYDTAIESTKVGAFSYIPKPFTPEELLENLQRGFDKRRLTLEAEKLKREREDRLLEIAFEKTRLNTIINSITDGVLVVNKEGETVLYNPAALKYLDLNEIKIEEKIIDKLHPKISEVINKFLLTKEQTAKSFSVQIDLKPNHEFFIEATASSVAHPNGSLAGVVVVLKDISDLKKIELLKSQFVSMVSHELKAPIAAVYGYLKLLNDDNISLKQDEKKKFLERSQVRLDGLLKMVNDLLDISRLEMKAVQREINDIDVKEVIEGIIELFSFEIKTKNISTKLKLNVQLQTLKADKEEINQVFSNLISNAIKYNKQDGEIIINLDSNDSYMIIEVEDNGIGLKPNEKEKLFNEFFRAKNELTKDISGTGLGLSIVKRIVDSYSGKIEVESEFNKGTKIKVYLPFLYKKKNKAE